MILHTHTHACIYNNNNNKNSDVKILNVKTPLAKSTSSDLLVSASCGENKLRGCLGLFVLGEKESISVHNFRLSMPFFWGSESNKILK